MAVGLGVTATVQATAATTADAPSGHVVFQSDRYVPRAETFRWAGASGVLHSEEGRGLVWTRWNGTNRLVTDDITRLRSLAAPADSDIVIRREGGVYTAFDLNTGGSHDFTPLAGHTHLMAVGRHLVTRTGAEGAYKHHLQRWDEGADVPTLAGEVLGMPVGHRLSEAVTANASTLVVTYWDDQRTYRYGLVDLDTRQFTPGPVTYNLGASQVVLAKDRLIAVRSNTEVRTLPLSDLDASPRSIPLAPKGDERPVIAATGDTLFVTWSDPNDPYDFVDKSGYRLEAIPLAGGEARTVLRHAAPSMLTTADGNVVAAGGEDSGSWALRKLSADGHAAKVADVPPLPAKVDRLSLANGVLDTAETDGHFLPSYQSRRIQTDGSGPVPDKDRTWLGWSHHTFPEEAPFSAGDGRHYAVVDNELRVRKLGDAPTGFFRTPSTSGSLVDLTGRYAIVDGADPAKQYVGDLGVHQDLQPIRTRAITAASVWGTSLWSQTATPGVLSVEDLKTRRTTTVDTGAPCRAEELQAVGRWVYWSCGPTASAGVWDTKLRKNIPVPSGEALVGDGYLVRHDKVAGRLLLTPFRDGAAGASRTVGELTSTEGRRGITWTVDKFGGPVAYVTSDRMIHLVPGGVPTEPLAVIESEIGSSVRDGVDAEPWSGRWLFSRPAATWGLAITNAAGTVVRSLDGEQAGSVSASWDGRSSAGTPLLNGTYTWSLQASPADGTGPVLLRSGKITLRGGVPVAAGTYNPVTPKRIMDTRTGLGAPKAKVGTRKTVALQVAGRGGVPSTGVTAVVMNVTATGGTATSYVSVYPNGTTRTSASNLNVAAGQTRPNLVVVPVVNGKVNFYNNAGSVHLIADVAGYYTAKNTGSRYEPVQPTRLMDTRIGLGAAKAKVGPRRTVTLQVAGKGGVPVTGATAVVMNVTATSATATSYISVYPNGTTRTSASSLNVTAGRTVPNLVVVPVVNGRVSFYNYAGSVHLIADVAGYYTSSGTGSVYQPTTPTRVMDTRTGWGAPQAKVGPGRTVTLHVSGRAGVPASGVTAVVMNVTATGPTATTYVAVYPNGTTRTSASNLNLVTGQTAPNLVVVPVVNGKVSFYNYAGSVHLVADVAGYYTG
jgi:hypothetical protein